MGRQARAAGRLTIYGLTFREVQVVGLMWRGLCTKEIAHELGLTFDVALNVRKSLLRKMRVPNGLAVIRRALELGILHVEQVA
jgi:DNA-binding NarL/FixJ family response regulator